MKNPVPSNRTQSSTRRASKAPRGSAVAKNAPDSPSLADHPFVPLNKKSFEPLYAQIQSQLREQIRLGRLSVNDPLPGEAELSRVFGVSRMTSRQALQGLTSDGLTYRERGRGTFVSPAKVEKQIAHLQGFSTEMRLLGLSAGTRVLGAGLVTATPTVAAALLLPPGTGVLRLHRLRLADGEPMAIEEAWIPQTRFPGIEKINFGRRSLYETLRERYGVKIGSAREVIEARGATRQEAELLEIPIRSSLLVVSRTLLDGEGQPMEMAYSLYRGDRYRAVLSIPAIESFAHSAGESSFEAKGKRQL
jgi:GntR family transcriptional regulator